MTALAAGSLVKAGLRGLDGGVKGYIKKKVRDKIQETGVSILKDQLLGMLPVDKLTGVFFGATKNRAYAGRLSSAKMRTAISDVFGDSGKYVKFSPGIRESTRDPAREGFRPTDVSREKLSDPNFDGVNIVAGVRRPDAVVGPFAVMEQIRNRRPTGDRNWLAAEFKLSTKTLISDYVGANGKAAKNPGQLQAIAKYTQRYTRTGRIALFVTLFAGGAGGKNYEMNVKLLQARMAKEGILGIIASLTGNK